MLIASVNEPVPLINGSVSSVPNTLIPSNKWYSFKPWFLTKPVNLYTLLESLYRETKPE